MRTPPNPFRRPRSSRPRGALPGSFDVAFAPVPPWQAWVETALLAGASIAICALLAGRDPGLLPGALPWVALAPLLAGLRYGTVHGVSCAVVPAAALAV